jgi:polyadenylate-binding protein
MDGKLEENKDASQSTSQERKDPSATSELDNTVLYVGGLKPGTSNNRLYDFFSEQKFSVVYANVKVSSKDLSNVFGVVKFCSEAEAQKALDSLNNTELDGSKVRLMWWNPTLVSKSKDNANVFVKDLDSSITQKDLSDRFSVFGNIFSVKLETFADGSSKGFGYVQFEEPDDAEKAINAMDGLEWKGKKITVNVLIKRGDREERKILKNNLYCRNFPIDYTEDELKKLFGTYGNITSIMIKPNSDNKKQAFICYETGEEAKKALDDLNGKFLEGCDEPLIVNELLNKHERTEENLKQYKKLKQQNLYLSLANNLYVNGIPKTCSEDDVRAEFERFGQVSSIKMHFKPSREDTTKSEFIGAAFV